MSKHISYTSKLFLIISNYSINQTYFYVNRCQIRKYFLGFFTNKKTNPNFGIYTKKIKQKGD